MVYRETLFADPHASSSAPYPQELHQWSSSIEEPLHSSTVEKSERRTMEIPTLPSTSVIPTSSNSWWNAKPFHRNAEPQRRAKHLGHTWYVFAGPVASSSAPYPQELNPWSSGISEPIHFNRRMRIKRHFKIRDASLDRQQKIQSSSVEETLQRIMGQTNNDCRFHTFISTNSLHQQRLLVGR